MNELDLQSLNEKITHLIEEYKKKHPEKKEKFEDAERLRKESGKLIIEYNKRLRNDEEYPNKDEVRQWFSDESSKLIAEGASSYNFLYCEFICPIEDLEKTYE